MVKEKHSGGLAKHFRIDKTLNLLKEKYYWPQMYKDVQKFVKSCGVCQIAKGVSQKTGLYTLLFFMRILGVTSVWNLFLDCLK